MSRFCAVSDAIRMTLDARWRKRALTYCVVAYVLDPASQDRELAEAWAMWTAVADFTVRQVPKSEAAGADIIIGAGRGPRSNFDGPSGVLAWAELPPGNDQQLLMRFDGDERWQPDFLRVVAAHEIGHLLGLDHDTARDVALMDPTYNPRVDRPQPADINRIQSLYGPARPGPTPPPTSPGGSIMREIVTIAVSTVLGAIAARLPSFLRSWVLAQQDRLVDFIMRRFNMEMRLAMTDPTASAEVHAAAAALLDEPPVA